MVEFEPVFHVEAEHMCDYDSVAIMSGNTTVITNGGHTAFFLISCASIYEFVKFWICEIHDWDFL